MTTYIYILTSHYCIPDDFSSPLCSLSKRKENLRDFLDMRVSWTPHTTIQDFWMNFAMSHHRLVEHNQHLDKRIPPKIGNVHVRPYPISATRNSFKNRKEVHFQLTCNVTNWLLIKICLLAKSVPIVALKLPEKFWLTYLLIRAVFPTLESPKTMILRISLGGFDME